MSRSMHSLIQKNCRLIRTARKSAYRKLGIVAINGCHGPETDNLILLLISLYLALNFRFIRIARVRD